MTVPAWSPRLKSAGAVRLSAFIAVIPASIVRVVRVRGHARRWGLLLATMESTSEHHHFECSAQTGAACRLFRAGARVLQQKYFM